MLTVEQQRVQNAERRHAEQQQAIAAHRRRIARVAELDQAAAQIAKERHRLAPTRNGMHNPSAVRVVNYETWLKSDMYAECVEAFAAIKKDDPRDTARRRAQLAKEAS